MNLDRAENRHAVRVLKGCEAAINTTFSGRPLEFFWHDAMSDSIEEANERHVMNMIRKQPAEGGH